MWNPNTVERALFSWEVWRESIIAEWREGRLGRNSHDLNQLRSCAAARLAVMRLPKCLGLELYWVACVWSDYCLGHPSTYKHIAVPDWIRRLYLPLIPTSFSDEPFHERMKPPSVWMASDRDYCMLTYLRPKGAAFMEMFLEPGHELLSLGKKMKGRPSLKETRGRPARYPDWIAVRCAYLFDSMGKTYVECARELDLPVTRPYESDRSETARYLLKRGKGLLEELRGPCSIGST
jgi:hypothetical protein